MHGEVHNPDEQEPSAALFSFHFAQMFGPNSLGTVLKALSKICMSPNM